MICSLQTSEKLYVAPATEGIYKPTVAYRKFLNCPIVIGETALVFNSVSHTLCKTGVVVAYDNSTGEFETEDTRYVLCTGYPH